MLALEAPKPGETYSLPVMAIMMATPGRVGYEAQLRAVFPNLRKYEKWEGSGHFLMMESPDASIVCWRSYSPVCDAAQPLLVWRNF